MNLRKAHAALLSVVCAAAGALVGACGSPPAPPIESSDMVGTWCTKQHDRLAVEPSGRFALSELSHDFFTVLNDDRAYTEEFVLKRDFGGRFPVTGSGTWNFGPGSTSPRLRLNFESLGLLKQPLGAELLARRDDQGEVGLFGFESDPDEGYTVKFLRCS